MISSEAIKKIRKIQITTSRMATDLFAGHYRSAFRGRGLEFGELRPYEAGDDIRFIDWNVTARTGRLHIKKFVEERELTVLFLVDLSGSSHFGTAERSKRGLASEICALLSFAALRTNDKIGLVLFTDRIEKCVPPRKGPRQALRIIRDVLYTQPEGKGTNLALALDFVHKILKRRTVIVLISDLFDSGFEKLLAIVAGRHDVMVVTTNDPAEKVLPDAGLIWLQDAETGRLRLVDSTDARMRRNYAGNNIDRIENRKAMLRSLRVDAVDLYTDRPYLPPLLQFFRQRERKLHGRP